MGKTTLTLAFLAMAGTLGALPQGLLEARSEGGHLTSFGSRWSPDDDFEARWWWRESGGGAAWVRAGAFQVGPLVARSGGDGWRAWSPGVTLGSGYWGVGVDTSQWGVWGLQSPEKLEAGAQARLAWPEQTLALGADRSWDLGAQPPETGPWTDRVRSGWTLAAESARLGFEATTALPAWGPRRWAASGHGDWAQGPWSARAAASLGDEPLAREPWSASGSVGWSHSWWGWSGRARQPTGWFETGWRAGGVEASLRWGPEAGEGGSARYQLVWGSLTARAEAEAVFTGDWEFTGGFSLAGRQDEGRWSCSWALSPGREGVAHIVTATWKQSTLEAEARWKTQGLQLGWLGPQADFALIVRWLI